MQMKPYGFSLLMLTEVSHLPIKNYIFCHLTTYIHVNSYCIPRTLMQGELLQIGIGEYLSYGSYCNQVLNQYFINIFLLNTLLSLAILTYYAAFWISTCYFRIHAVFNYIWQASEISFRCIENIYIVLKYHHQIYRNSVLVIHTIIQTLWSIYSTKQ